VQATARVSLETVFDVRHLTKAYRMGDVDVVALRDVSLALPEKEWVMLLGPSGSGKFTLLNILGDLDLPTSGACVLPADGVDEGRRGRPDRVSPRTSGSCSSSGLQQDICSLGSPGK